MVVTWKSKNVCDQNKMKKKKAVFFLCNWIGLQIKTDFKIHPESLQKKAIQEWRLA